MVGTWMDEEGFKKTCIKKKKKRGGIQQPLYGTWVADFMLRQDAGRFMLGKYLSDKKNFHIPNLSFIFSNTFFGHLYFRIYQNIFKISLNDIFQNLQNSFQKHPRKLVHRLQTCVLISKPEFAPKKNWARLGQLHRKLPYVGIFRCILETQSDGDD